MRRVSWILAGESDSRLQRGTSGIWRSGTRPRRSRRAGSATRGSAGRRQAVATSPRVCGSTACDAADARLGRLACVALGMVGAPHHHHMPPTRPRHLRTRACAQMLARARPLARRNTRTRTVACTHWPAHTGCLHARAGSAAAAAASARLRPSGKCELVVWALAGSTSRGWWLGAREGLAYHGPRNESVGKAVGGTQHDWSLSAADWPV